MALGIVSRRIKWQQLTTLETIDGNLQLTFRFWDVASCFVQKYSLVVLVETASRVLCIFLWILPSPRKSCTYKVLDALQFSSHTSDGSSRIFITTQSR